MKNNKEKRFALTMKYSYGKEQTIMVQASCVDVSWLDGFTGLTVKFFLIGENDKLYPVKFPYDYKFFTKMHDDLKQEFINLKFDLPSDNKFISER